MRKALLSLTILGCLGAAGAAADDFDEDYRYAAALMADRGEYAAAAEKFAALGARPDARAAKALYCLANCRLKMKDERQAAECYEKIVRDFPDDKLAADAAGYGADAFFRAGDPARAEELYSLLLAKYPQHPAARAAAYWRAECRVRLAAAEKDAARAEKLYQGALADYRAFTAEPQAMLAEALFSAGGAAFARGDYAAAAEFYGRLDKEFPAHPQREEALYRLAESAYWRQDAARAEELYRRLRQEFPGGKLAADALAGLGWCAYGRKDFRAAGEKFAEAASLRSDPAAAAAGHFDAGAAFAEAGIPASAEAEFRHAAAAGNPRALAAQLRLGGLARAEKTDAGRARAEKYYVEALAAAGDDQLGAEAAAMLGGLRLGRGDAAGAETAFAAGWEKWPESRFAAFSAYHLALAQMRQEKNAAAAETLRGLLGRYPHRRFRLAAAYAMADCQLALQAPEKARAAWGWLADEGRAWAEKAAALPENADEDFNAVRAQAAALGARALLRLGESFYGAEAAEPARAEAYFARLTREYPNDPLAAAAELRLGEIAEKKNDAAGAVAHCRAALAALEKSGVKDAAAENVRMHAAYRLAAAGVLQAPADGAGREKALADAAAALRKFIEDFSAPAAQSWRARARYYLAEAEHALGHKAEAEAAYAAAYADDPRGTLADAALFGAAWYAREKGEGARAAELCQKLLDGFPQSASTAGALRMLCAHALETKKYDDGLNWARRLGKEFPAERARAEVAEAQLLDGKGEAAAAEKILAKYQEKPAADSPEAGERARALQVLSLACWHQAEPKLAAAGKAEQAFKDFLGGRKMRELEDGKRARATELRQAWLDALSGAREVENRMIAALETLAREYPELPGRAETLLRLGETAYERGSLAAAREHFMAALAADAAAVADKAHYRLGWCALRRLGSAGAADKAALRTEARREFAAVVEKSPDSRFAGESAWQAAELAREVGDCAAALPLYEKAMQDKSQAEIAAGAECARALCLLELEKYGEAAAAFKAFVGGAGKDAGKAWLPQAEWGAGYAALRLGAYDEARDYFLAAKENRGDGEAAAKARYGLGLIEFTQGHWKNAREEFRKVEIFHSAWPEVAALALVKAAAASRELGEAESASADLRRVLERYAGASSAGEAKEMLQKLARAK